jgi:hypothetical protein
MTIYSNWVDFITYPLQPDRVKTEAERLDTRHAAPSRAAPALLDNRDQPFIVSSEELQMTGDEFEAMEIDGHGNVTIWGKKYVYHLNRGFGMEKLVFLPRHPPKGG